MAKNRISAITKWPTDPVKCLQRADRDLDFVQVLVHLGFELTPALADVKSKAFSMRIRAQDDLARRNQ